MKKLFAGLMAVFIGFFALTSTVIADDYSYLLPPAKSDLLGVASGFSVFVEDDFSAQGSDCEGSLAAGGGANLGNFEWYSTKSNTEYASVVVGDGPLCNFTGGNRKFVVGTNCPDEDIKVQGEVYKADLINFEKEFQHLREVSQSLAEQDSVAAQVSNTWCKQITFTGTNSDYNFFTIDATDLSTDQCFITFDVPAGSYSVVNVLGSSVNLYTQLYGMSYAGKNIASNDDASSEQILWNLPNATAITLNGTGTFRGSILAPNADGSDSMTSGAHVAGELIAKSYNGGIEWGGLSFSGSEFESVPKVTTTTSTSEVQTTLTSSTSGSSTSVPIASDTTTVSETFETTNLTSSTYPSSLSTYTASVENSITSVAENVIQTTKTIPVATATSISSSPKTGDDLRGLILIPFVIAGVFWGTMVKKNFA